MIFRKESMLFHLKLTGLFVAFGLLIGLLSYFTSTVTTARVVASTFIESDSSPIKNMLSGHPHDWLYSTLSRGKSSSAINFMKNIIPPEFRGSISLTFYFKKKKGTAWYLLKNTDCPEQPIQKITKENLYKNLTSTLTKKIIMSEHPFLDFSRSRTLYFDVTSPKDENDYVARATINRKNMIDYIFDKGEAGIQYLVVTFIFSLIIGFFFSRSIAKPLKNLSGKALDFSKGDLTVRFQTSRKDDIGVLSRSLDQMAVNISYRIATIQTMNKIDRAVNSSLSRKELITKVIHFIAEQFPGSVLFVLEKDAKSYILTASSPDGILSPGLRIPFDKLSDIFLQNAAIPIELDDITLSQINKRIKSGMPKKRGISIPLKQADEITGLLVFAGDSLSSRDRDSLILLADQVGVALLNLKEHTERHRLYDGVIYALSRSIDAKSRWTAGHSERVAEFSVKLAEQIHLGKKILNTVRIAALLHDIGKLGISEEILDKPGKLTEEEYAHIKEHPVIGYNIIADIPHFEQIQYAVRHHHERWDGNGYPDGLSRDAIPLTARIIAIADVWDAITAERPYRKEFSKEESIKIMQAEKGRLFDPTLLDEFLKLI